MEKQTQFKPNLSQNKPNSNPTCRGVALSEAGFIERAKMNAFAWIENLTIVLIMLLAEFTTLKGANFRWITYSPTAKPKLEKTCSTGLEQIYIGVIGTERFTMLL